MGEENIFGQEEKMFFLPRKNGLGTRLIVTVLCYTCAVRVSCHTFLYHMLSFVTYVCTYNFGRASIWPKE